MYIYIYVYTFMYIHVFIYNIHQRWYGIRHKPENAWSVTNKEAKVTNVSRMSCEWVTNDRQKKLHHLKTCHESRMSCERVTNESSVDRQKQRGHQNPCPHRRAHIPLLSGAAPGSRMSKYKSRIRRHIMSHEWEVRASELIFPPWRSRLLFWAAPRLSHEWEETSWVTNELLAHDNWEDISWVTNEKTQHASRMRRQITRQSEQMRHEALSHAHIHTCTNAHRRCEFGAWHTHTHTHTYTYTHTHTHAHTQTHTHKHTPSLTHTHTHSEETHHDWRMSHWHVSSHTLPSFGRRWWVMSHISRSHVTHIKESYHTCTRWVTHCPL